MSLRMKIALKNYVSSETRASQRRGKILGQAIGIAGYKLQLLAYYDVEVVFANELAQAPDRAVS